MARPDRQARRRDLNVILPGAQSLLLVGLDYRSDADPEAALQDPARGRIASYAWNLDYHDLMLPRLESLAAWMTADRAAPSAATSIPEPSWNAAMRSRPGWASSARTPC